MMKAGTRIFITLLIAANLFSMSTIVQNCKKEHAPDIYGEWETLSAVGFFWEYSIDEKHFCRTLPEYFDTSFCFDYDRQGNVLKVKAAQEETWSWDFEADNIAVVTVEIPGEQNKTLVLRRK